MNAISTFENGPRKSIIKTDGFTYFVEYYLDNRLIGTSRHTVASLAEDVADKFVLVPGGEQVFLSE